MLHPTDNKENLKNANTLYSRDNNKSKINLLEPTLKSESIVNTLAFADEVLFKIYQQRIKNKQLYDKIREVDSFFSYELRPQLKNYSNQDMQVKQYGMLLEEYELLEKHWTKIETLLHRNTQQQSSKFHFLIAPWQKIQRKCLENDSTQILQRLNKTILVIKKDIDASLKSKTKYDENFTYRQFLMNTPQYLILHRQLQRAQNSLKQKEEQLQSLKNQNEIVIQNYKKENETLSRKLEQLQTKLKQMANKQKQLYFVKSKMSKQLLEADNKLQEYRSQKQYTKRYISTVNEGDNLPLFQIQIKQKSDQLDKMNTFKTDKSIREIEKYLNSTCNQQKNDSENRDQFFDKNNQGNAMQEISKHSQPKQSSQKSQSQPEQLCYSSTKKRKISAMRQIYSGSKLFPKRSSQDNESVAKEVKFMRKR